MGNLIGGLGQEIKAIGCDGIGGTDVITTDDNSELAQTRVGMAIRIKSELVHMLQKAARCS